MKKIFILSGILFLAIFLTSVIKPDDLIAADQFRKGPCFRYMDQLTKEQRETIKNTVRDLHDSGETPENIHVKVKEMLKEYGVDVPDDAELFPPMRGHRPGRLIGRYLKDLNEEQKSTLRKKVDQLHEQGASRAEIHAEVQKMLKEFGVDVPADSPPKMGRGEGFPHGFPGADLSKEQRMAIREKVKSLRENKVDREEIHAAVTEMLESYGIEIPEKFDHRHGEKWQCLTEEQRQALRTKIREMRESGASREEIHEAVKKMTEEFDMNQEMD
jgi:DNA-binding transcriptional regulator YhcF (GntR family)